jgi:hypothetical protein
MNCKRKSSVEVLGKLRSRAAMDSQDMVLCCMCALPLTAQKFICDCAHLACPDCFLDFRAPQRPRDCCASEGPRHFVENKAAATKVLSATAALLDSWDRWVEPECNTQSACTDNEANAYIEVEPAIDVQAPATDIGEFPARDNEECRLFWRRSTLRKDGRTRTHKRKVLDGPISRYGDPRRSRHHSA